MGRRLWAHCYAGCDVRIEFYKTQCPIVKGTAGVDVDDITQAGDARYR